MGIEEQNTKKQVCSIMIMLPCESDEQAVGLKKQIEKAVEGISDVRIDFRLTQMPLGAIPSQK